MLLMFDPGMMDGGNVRIAQLVSLILVLVGAFLIVWRRATGRATVFYRDEATLEAPATASAQASAEKEPSASAAETKTNAQAEEKEGQAKA
jgi:phosphatidylglycerol:prolipoprotein diacylglycerol transferase